MGALAPLNLFVILNTHVPEALGESRLREEEVKSKFHQSAKLEEIHDDSQGGLRRDETANVHEALASSGPSAELARSLASKRHPSGDDVVGNNAGQAFRMSLGAAACGSIRGSRGTTVTAGAALIGAMGIAAFGVDPVGNLAPIDATNGVVGECDMQSDNSNGSRFSTLGGKSLEVESQQFPDGFSSGGSTSSKPPKQTSDAIATTGIQHEATCQCSCPGVIMVPRHLVDNVEVLEERIKKDRRGNETQPKITLVMSRDNIAALAIITVLSIFGAIYLWKICTRKRCSCRICRNQYRTLSLLGSGGYGAVYLVDRVADGSRFVSKKIPVRDITEVDEYSLEAKELVTLRHRHIVSYEDDFVHVEYGTLEPKTYFIIIMEFCPEGDLKEKIELDFCNFTEDYVRTVFAQILQAVQYLHSKNVIHRDLKSQNVFLAQDGRVRLGDFGLCKHTRAQAGPGCATFSHAGTDCYMAPEMLSSSRYGKPADMWSLGCVLYELVTGQFMWELDGMLGAMVMKDNQTVNKLLQQNMVPCVGKELTSLLKRLLSINHGVRPTATACIRKKLFKRSFNLSRQPFGEFLGDPEVDTQIPSDNSGSPSTPETKSCGISDMACVSEVPNASDDEDNAEDQSVGEEEEEEEEEQVVSVPFATRNDDFPKRKRRPRKKRAMQLPRLTRQHM